MSQKENDKIFEKAKVLEPVPDYKIALIMQNKDSMIVITVYIENEEIRVVEKVIDKPNAKYFIIGYDLTKD